jgi:hypothetical protein
MRHRQTRLIPAHQPPCYVGIDLGKPMHHADVVAVEGPPCTPTARALAHPRAGSPQRFPAQTEATAQAAPTEMTGAVRPRGRGVRASTKRSAPGAIAGLASILSPSRHGGGPPGGAPQPIAVRRAAKTLAIERRLLWRPIRARHSWGPTWSARLAAGMPAWPMIGAPFPGWAMRPHRRLLRRSGPVGASPLRSHRWPWLGAIPSAMSPGTRPGRRRCAHAARHTAGGPSGLRRSPPGGSTPCAKPSMSASTSGASSIGSHAPMSPRS